MRRVYLLVVWVLACCLSCTEENRDLPEPVPEPPVVKPEPDPDPIIWKNYIPASMELIKDSVWPDGKGETFVVQNHTFSGYMLNDLFVLKDGIYPGMVVDVDLNRTPMLKPITGVEYNPITYSTWPFVGAVTTSQPTEQICREMRDKVLAVLGDISSFSASSSSYHSAKELYMLRAYEGIRLDSILNGRAYPIREMKKKNGLLYSFIYTAFSIIMDYPVGKLLKEDPASYTSLRYISSVSYGVRGYLTIESDSTQASVKSVVEKLKRGEGLTKGEETLLKDSDVRSVLISSGKGGRYQEELGPTLEGAKSIIVQYFAPGSLNMLVDILDVQFVDYQTHGVADVPIRIDAPVSSRE